MNAPYAKLLRDIETEITSLEEEIGKLQKPNLFRLAVGLDSLEQETNKAERLDILRTRAEKQRSKIRSALDAYAHSDRTEDEVKYLAALSSKLTRIDRIEEQLASRDIRKKIPSERSSPPREINPSKGNDFADWDELKI